MLVTQRPPTQGPLTRDDLIVTLFGAGAFQILNAGCELGLFSLLCNEPGLTAGEIAGKLALRSRPTQVLLLGTTALRLTSLADGRYRNAALLDESLRDGSWEILRDMVAFEAHIVYQAQADFVESLRQDTNVGLRRFPGQGTDLYHRLAGNPELEALFYRCMRSWSRLSNPVLTATADLTGVTRVVDVGGGDGVNAIALATRNPGVDFTVLDLPGAAAIARTTITEAGLADRVTVCEADIFTDPYPPGHDCVLFANQLVIWSPEQNLQLLTKAYDTLPDGGRVLVFSAMSNTTGDGPLYSALDNVYFTTLPAASSRIYQWDEYQGWLTSAGFSQVRFLPGDTWTPHGVISATR
ncbi:MAG: methyltransferase [Pseudonocardiaceae bacterium]